MSVVNAGSVAEQYWGDVNVDETEARQLPANVRREEVERLSVGGLKPDSDGFLHGAFFRTCCSQWGASSGWCVITKIGPVHAPP